MCLTLDTWVVVLNSMELVRCLKLSRWLSALFGWPCRAPSPRSPVANSLRKATSGRVFLLHSGGRHSSREGRVLQHTIFQKSCRRITLFSVIDFNMMRAFARGTFWPRGACDLSDTVTGQGGEKPKQMKLERWYKDRHTGLVFHKDMHLLALSSPTNFRETLVCSVLTWKYSASCRIRTWSYLCVYLFSLTLLAARILRFAAQRWEGDPPSPGTRCVIACPSFYPLHPEWKGAFPTDWGQNRSQVPFTLRQREDTDTAGLPCHRFLLAASTCLRIEPLLQLLFGTKGSALPRKVRLSVAVWVPRS